MSTTPPPLHAAESSDPDSIHYYIVRPSDIAPFYFLELDPSSRNGLTEELLSDPEPLRRQMTDGCMQRALQRLFDIGGARNSTDDELEDRLSELIDTELTVITSHPEFCAAAGRTLGRVLGISEIEDSLISRGFKNVQAQANKDLSSAFARMYPTVDLWVHHPLTHHEAPEETRDIRVAIFASVRKLDDTFSEDDANRLQALVIDRVLMCRMGYGLGHYDPKSSIKTVDQKRPVSSSGRMDSFIRSSLYAGFREGQGALEGYRVGEIQSNCLSSKDLDDIDKGVWSGMTSELEAKWEEQVASQQFEERRATYRAIDAEVLKISTEEGREALFSSR